MTNNDMRKIVDGILKADKALVGISSWKPDPDGDAWRWLGSVEINDEQHGITLVAKVYPRSEELKFSIMLNFQRCIWRLDFTTEGHLNPLNAPAFGGMVIRVPHYHSWLDNRALATSNSLPKRLRNARPLPESIRNFYPAFRWFLEETNIYVEAGEIPDLPKRDTLL